MTFGFGLLLVCGTTCWFGRTNAVACQRNFSRIKIVGTDTFDARRSGSNRFGLRGILVAGTLCTNVVYHSRVVDRRIGTLILNEK